MPTERDSVSSTVPASPEGSLELANTLLGLGARRVDLLDSPTDLVRWLEEIQPAIGPAPAETGLRLADFRSLREAIRSVFGSAATGEPVSPEAVEAVNAVSAAVSAYPSLDASDPRAPVVVDVPSAGSRTGEILALIARSAIGLAGGPDRERLRTCGGSGCGRFFLASRPGQVWHSPACGNRARVARHHARRRASSST
jgi:predicted RNA-binding Zn ribbon-like protein